MSEKTYEERKAYFSARYQTMKQKPGFMEEMARRAQEQRKKNPEATRRQNAKRRSADPEAARQRVRVWFAKNPEKRRAYEANRRAKLRSAGGKLSPNIIETLMVLQRGRCACCKASLKEVKANLDHIIPLALGGQNGDHNVQLLCQPCNNSKYSKHPVDFMQSRGFLL